jgi:ABC-2 type transport system permease protein
MTALVRAELLKVVSTRTVLGFAAAGVAVNVLNVLVITLASGTLDDMGEKKEALSGLPVVPLLLGLVGAAGEYRHRTAAPAALAARRDRGTLLLGRAAAYALAGLALGALMAAVALGLGLPLLTDQPGPAVGAGDAAIVVVGSLLACTLSAILGAAVGALVRNQVAGVVVVLLVSFVITPLISAVDESLANVTPFGAAGVLATMTHDTTLSLGAAGVVLAAWTGALLLVAITIERGRDVT